MSSGMKRTITQKWGMSFKMRCSIFEFLLSFIIKPELFMDQYSTK